MPWRNEDHATLRRQVRHEGLNISPSKTTILVFTSRWNLGGLGPLKDKRRRGKNIKLGEVSRGYNRFEAVLISPDRAGAKRASTVWITECLSRFPIQKTFRLQRNNDECFRKLPVV